MLNLYDTRGVEELGTLCTHLSVVREARNITGRSIMKCFTDVANYRSEIAHSTQTVQYMIHHSISFTATDLCHPEPDNSTIGRISTI